MVRWTGAPAPRPPPPHSRSHAALLLPPALLAAPQEPTCPPRPSGAAVRRGGLANGVETGGAWQGVGGGRACLPLAGQRGRKGGHRKGGGEAGGLTPACWAAAPPHITKYDTAKGDRYAVQVKGVTTTKSGRGFYQGGFLTPDGAQAHRDGMTRAGLILPQLRRS